MRLLIFWPAVHCRSAVSMQGPLHFIQPKASAADDLCTAIVVRPAQPVHSNAGNLSVPAASPPDRPTSLCAKPVPTCRQTRGESADKLRAIRCVRSDFHSASVPEPCSENRLFQFSPPVHRNRSPVRLIIALRPRSKREAGV